MASRMSVSKAKSLLEKLHEAIMESVNLYFVSNMTKWLSGMRGRSQAGSLATNPRTQLTQSQWKDSKSGAMQKLPEGHSWGTSGSIARYDSIFIEPANPTVGLHMAMDILLTRAQPPVIVYVAARALSTLPKTLLTSEVKKRLGVAGPAFCKWIAATNELAGAILEVGAEKKRRKKATRISWAELSTPRAKKAKTPKSALVSKAISDTTPNRPSVSKDEASLLIHMESKVPEVCAQFDNGWDLGMLAKGMLEGNSLKELKTMSKDELTEAAVLDTT